MAMCPLYAAQWRAVSPNWERGGGREWRGTRGSGEQGGVRGTRGSEGNKGE